MDFLPDIEKFKNFFDGTDSKNEISIAVEEAKKYDIFNLISRKIDLCYSLVDLISYWLSE